MPRSYLPLSFHRWSTGNFSFRPIKISYTISLKECSTTFLIDNVYEEELYKAFKVERRLLLARDVMDLLHGKILTQDDGSGGKIFMLSIKLGA